jgi:tRNA/rRNA methyltransferase
MLPTSPYSENTHIVLIEPQDSLNVGSIARAMMNFGYQHLHLVCPHEFSLDRALITGRWAEGLLREARVHDSLDTALRDMHDVVGFSSHHRPRRGEPTLLPDWINTKPCSGNQSLALLFGREDTGLTPEAIEQCRLLVRIPSRAEYPALNLAQSALVVMYELSKDAWPDIERTPTELPSWNQIAQLDRLCDEVMSLAGFHHSAAGDPTAASVKNILRRSQMNERELRIMLALFNRIRISLTRSGG